MPDYTLADHRADTLNATMDPTPAYVLVPRQSQPPSVTDGNSTGDAFVDLIASPFANQVCTNSECTCYIHNTYIQLVQYKVARFCHWFLPHPHSSNSSRLLLHSTIQQRCVRTSSEARGQQACASDGGQRTVRVGTYAHQNERARLD